MLPFLHINHVDVSYAKLSFLIFIIAQMKIRRMQLGRQPDEIVKINVAYAFEEY